jgi:hypothetical protein
MRGSSISRNFVLRVKGLVRATSTTPRGGMGTGIGRSVSEAGFRRSREQPGMPQSAW